MGNATDNRATYLHAEDLGGLMLLNAEFSTQRFSRHVHEGYVFGVIDRGAQKFLREGARHLAPRDSIILVNADQVHDGHCAYGEGWSYRAIYPTEVQLAPLCEDLSGANRGLPWFQQPVVHDPLMAQRLRHFFDVLAHSDNRLARESVCVSALTDMVLRHGKHRTSTRLMGHPVAVQKACDYVRDNLSKNISLSELAQLVNLSPYYLNRLFQRHTGLAPHGYQNVQRVLRAKQLLHTQKALRDIALAVGFADQSHFSRHFKRVMGTSPGRYRRQI